MTRTAFASTPAGRRGKWRAHPAQVVLGGFVLAILVGTGLLSLPIAKAGPGGATLIEALFTAVSAACVTGHVIVDTATFWSPFGQVGLLHE